MGTIVTLTPNPALDSYAEIGTLTPDVKLRTSAPRLDPGGGGINVSRLATRLGGKTAAVAALGGLTGQRVLALLEAEGIRPLPVDIAGETRASFVVKAKDTGHLYRFVTPGPTLTAEEGDAILAMVERQAAPGDVVVGSGSLPPGLPPGFWARAAEAARAGGARFVLDSSAGAMEAMAAGLDVLRLNHVELAALAGETLAWPDGAAAWAKEMVRAHDCRAIVVTHGAEGAILVTAEDTVSAKPPPVRVDSAVGAGDSFIAGLACAMLRRESDQDALCWGVASAAATMETPGTALSAKEDIERIREAMR